MPGSRYLLDTNAAIRLLEGDRAFQNRLRGEVETFLSVTVLGELYFGAMKSARADANLDRIERLVEKHDVLYCDQETAYQYGKFKTELRRKGRPIPDNDMWIAATAKQYELTLVADDAHFAHVDGLDADKW